MSGGKGEGSSEGSVSKGSQLHEGAGGITNREGSRGGGGTQIKQEGGGSCSFLHFRSSSIFVSCAA